MGEDYPGVYVEESGFPRLVAVDTAVPAFLGYVAAADVSGEPQPVASLAEFESRFGGPAPEVPGRPEWRLHEAMRLHYAHGGRDSLVVPVGHCELSNPADPAPLYAALERVARERGPTLLLAPDALLLSSGDYHLFAAAMLDSCARIRDRMAILDLHGGGDPSASPAGDLPMIEAFRAALAPSGAALGYGAAYHPWLVSPTGRRMPPSGAIAGLYRQVDDRHGVWKAPANVALDGSAVAGPTVRYSDSDQQELNAPVGSLSINAIRAFPGRGTLVWGARTLDGNDPDSRYVSVRRTLIWVEQSIRSALAAYVFEPNNASTWVAVKTMIQNFLIGIWRQGALPGAKPDEAFSVACGLGETMTAGDVLDNVLMVNVMLALVRPAEFQILTFSQKMAPV